MKRKKIATDNNLDKRPLTKEMAEVITEKTTDTEERVEKMEARGRVVIDEVSSETMKRGSTETDIMRQATEMNLVTREKMITEEADTRMIVIVKDGTTVRDTMIEKYLLLLALTRDTIVNCQLLIPWRIENRYNDD